jgi:hypothetical protein
MVDQSQIVKDEKTGAVISKEHGSLAEYKKKKNLLREKNDKIKELENRVFAIEEILKSSGLM